MRKITTLLLVLMIATFAFGKSVTMEQANLVANKYLSATSLKATRSVANSFSKSYNGITTYYVFNYTGGGFVVVSADDAARPILAQSDEGFIEAEITNPEARYWFENYSKEIAHIAAAKAVNTESLDEWNKILYDEIKAPSTDVAPLLALITWDQTAYYNYYCPADATAPYGFGGKVPVGCVATTMGQIMKYHNFPETGIGSYTYTSAYRQETANFGATTYNFSKMSNTATFRVYTDIATLLYHAGVAVNMNYAADGSGAHSESVPFALSNYFNYDNSTIGLAYMSNYSPAEWEALLKSELDAKRPLYYSGSDLTSGHAWVCDGYSTSGATTMFHMNWGWSGANNGYFAIGALNSGNGDFNFGNAIVYGIKPGNPNLIVRFTDLGQNNMAQLGPAFDINCSVIKGTPTAVNLYIDNQIVYNTTATTFSFPWNTSAAGIGTHNVRLEAIDATDTVYWDIKIGLSEWDLKASGFIAASRGIKYMQAVNSDVVWATAYDGKNSSNYIQEFTKTIDGGNTWTPGIINNCTGLEPAMVFAFSKDTAYVPMYVQTGINQGIYVTRDGGTTWNRQSTASFSNASSFPNVIHFFNKNEGFCMGDPINGDFEIYTTSNGGTNWTLVPGANIADPASGEFGVVGYYSAVGDKAWFGTNEGRVYRTSDKGLHWDVSATTFTNTDYTDVEFRDALHGLAQDKSTSGTFSETSDGGVTWTAVISTGVFGTTDFCYVPGTENTWVSADFGAYYSFDGGHSWATFPGTQAGQFLTVDFANSQSGFAGTFNASATSMGIYQYSGILEILSPVTNLTAIPGVNMVQLSWTAPATVPLSYNIYCNDVLITNTASLDYADVPLVGGSLNYCVAAVYALGESPKICATAIIILGLANTDQAAYRIYPNPSSDIINVVAPAKFNEVRMINSLGKVVYKNNTKGTNLRILTNGFEPGMYILQIYTGTQIISKKVSIVR
ncbi:MAG: C10 family peptidase [Bacteroidales bacterium]|nr:C10 family peptidase [Bacteroidales bacterium]